MKKINTNYDLYDVEELTKYIPKRLRKSPIRKMRKHKEDRQMYEVTNRDL